MKHITSKLLSLLLCLAMLMSMVPAAYADDTESNGSNSEPSDENTTVITSNDALTEAINNAADGATITLGEGEFTTYGNTSPNKSLTFVGAGEKTVWTIGNLTANVGGEGNGDYSFDGCDTITFKHMTLKSDGADYRGFIRINNTVVENCTLEGKTAYWGYTTATFTGCTFKAPEGDYALWDYSTPSMTFNNCTFNISGKGINVYVEAGNAGNDTRTVAVNGCKVDSTKANKAFLNIKNSTQSYDVTFSGTNTVTGLNADGTTNSALYQVEATEVTEISGKPVKVQEKAADGTLTPLYEVKPAAQPTAVAEVGGTSYDTLADALAALNSSNYTLTLLNDSAWNAATPVYWAVDTQSGYATTLTKALTAAYTGNQGDITIVCRPGADVGTMTHGHVADNLTIYGNNAYISGGECDLEVDTYMYSRETGKQVTENGVYLDKDITITAYELDNLGVWGQRTTNHTVTVNLTDCDGNSNVTPNVQRVYISGATGVNNITLKDCDFITNNTSVYSNADGAVVIDNCSFTGSQVPVNFNHEATGTQTVTVKNSTFAGCGDDGDWKQFAAPVRFVNSGKGTSTTAVENCTFSGTVGSNGDILIGDGRTGQASNDVSLKVTNTSANVQAQQPGYYNGDTTDASKKGEKKVEKSDTPFTTSVTELTTSTELTNYVTLELTFGSSVNAEDIAAAKAMYEGKEYETCKAANEAFMALYGVSWVEREGGKPYLNVTDNDAPLRAYATNADAVTEVKYYIHGTLAGFTSLQSDGNQIDCTVGGNHQIPRTSISIIGMNGSDGSKAKLTDGNVQAYVAGGYDNMFRSSGKLTIDNIEFTSTTSTTVGASAAVDANATQTVTSAEMEIKNCVFRGRLYVYDNFENTGMTYNIHNNVFDGRNYSGDSNAYSIFAQCRGGNKLNIKNNDISGFARGINIDHANINAVIEGNTISITDQGRSCIQLSSLATTTISGNTLKLTGGNAITLHEKLLTLTGAPVVSIENNTITGNGYLIYDDAAANNKEFTAENLKLNYGTNTVDNTIDTKQGVKGATKYALSGSVNTVVNGSTAPKGSETNPYTLAELGAMTRDAYIAAQTRLGGTMYVTVGDYKYDTNGVLGNGVRDDQHGGKNNDNQLNYYAANGYLNDEGEDGKKNDGANGRSIVFVNGSITSGATGYTSIDNIGTSLLLAVPAYTNVTFQNITFKNVMSFDYQLYTSPWSQLGELKFDGCTFNGIIVGAIAAQTLTFTGCTFTDYTNSTSANNSNPTWIRPAYGNWTKGDNEGQGGDFRSLTTINFTGNKVTSTRPVKFERIAQWEMPTTVKVTDNTFKISKQDGDTSTKNVGLYFGANAKFDLVAASNTKSDDTAALYTAVYSAPNGVSYPGLPAGSTVKDITGKDVKLSDAYAWKTTDAIALETTAEVAEVGGVKFATLADAIAAAAKGRTVTLLADTRENVTIAKALTLDLNGHTLNGSTGERKPALTITARVTVKDSSEGQTGTIMREDTAGNSGVSSHYVIDVQGDGWLTFESGNVTNGSGAGGTNGASLVRVGDDSVAKYPGLNIKGGTFTQDNFIVIKVDRGDLFLNGGTLKSANSYAVQSWHRATIKGGTVNGNVSSWTYSGGLNSDLTISGGIVNGKVEAVSYDGSAGKKASVSITGGVVNGTLITGIYGKPTEPTKDMATIKVTAGTFSQDPSKYLVEGSTATQKVDGNYSVAKAYLAKVGNTSYYTMDEAFKAQTASGKPIVLLRDYTTGSTFNSGSINRTVDLNGHTWTCTGTDANSAAFEINYPDVTLTVKNGKIVSSQLVGLIPSASGGTITYDNPSLTFDGVKMSTTATSGIETNGNNTNDSVTLKNSTLDVPNGFGIYFPSSGKLTIENSTINAKTMGVQVCAGSLNINGGSKITVTGDAVPKGEGDGAIQDGAAISIVNRPGYKGLGNITVTGGTFTAKTGNAAIKAYNWNNTTKTEETFTESTKVSVSGGTFSSAVPEDLCAPNYEPVANDNGTYGVAHFNVARIDNIYYESLQEAFNAVKVDSQQTIVLLHDVTVTKTLTFERNYSDTPTILKMQGHSITGKGCRALQIVNGHLKIEGKTDEASIITSTGIAIDSSVIRVGANGVKEDSKQVLNLMGVKVTTDCSYGITVFGASKEQLVVTNSEITSTAENVGDNFDGCAISTVGSDMTKASVTINGGTVAAEHTNAIYLPSGNLLVYGDVTVRGLTGIYAKSGIVQIRGAKICGTGALRDYEYNGNGGVPTGDALVLDSCGYPNGAPQVNYTNAGSAYFESTKAKPIGSYEYGSGIGTRVTGFVDKGTFNKSIDADLLADDYICKYDAVNKLYGVDTVASCDAKIGNVYYESLADAIAAAQDGDTVTLVADVTLDATLKVTKTLTLDLNGRTISNTENLWAVAGEDDWSLISVRGNGNLTINDTSTEKTGALRAKANDCYALDVYDVGCELTINAGTYVGNISAIYAFVGKVTINGGHFSIQQLSNSNDYRFMLNCYDANYKAGTAGFTVNGGTFDHYDPMNNEAEGKGTSFVAEGVGVDADSTNGTFTAKPNMAAQIVNAKGESVKAYGTLSAALSAVQPDETVKLITNVSDGGFVAVNAGTLDLNGYNLTANGIMGMPAAAIIDSTQGVGKLTVSVLYIANQTNANYLPVKDSDGSYRLFEYKVSDYVFLAKDDKRNERKVDVFYFKQQFNSAANLSQNTADGVTATITLTWDGQENPVSFTLSADSVKDMMTAKKNNTSYPYLSIVGYGAAYEKEISAVMTVSSAGVTFTTNAVVRLAPSSEAVD